MMKTYTFSKLYSVMQPANEEDGEWCLTDEALEERDTLNATIKHLRELLIRTLDTADENIQLHAEVGSLKALLIRAKSSKTTND
jgi:hypothetical protein